MSLNADRVSNASLLSYVKTDRREGAGEARRPESQLPGKLRLRNRIGDEISGQKWIRRTLWTRESGRLQGVLVGASPRIQICVLDYIHK